MIAALPAASVHAITSNQVVISLETAVKELVENSLDAGATSLEIRFKQYGVKSVEVIDNGSGIAEADWERIGLKHHTSKIASWSDLSQVHTFGFRGEALSSLCAMCDEVTVTTRATEAVGVVLDLDKTGKVKGKKRVARQRGTTISLVNPFAPLPVRRKDFERNAKREYGKALSLLQGYALFPCAKEPGVRLLVSNVTDKGSKTISIQTQGIPSIRSSVTALWGPKSLDGVQDITLQLSIPRPKLKQVVKRSMREEATLRAETSEEDPLMSVKLSGLISSPGHGRGGTDRQFFYVNGRPCSLGKVQKTFNDVFRSFTANHDVSKAPLVIVDLELPTDSYDVNVTPDKRTILLHNESVLLEALKAALEDCLAPSRSTYDVYGSQRPSTQSTLSLTKASSSSSPTKASTDDDEDDESDVMLSKRKSLLRRMGDLDDGPSRGRSKSTGRQITQSASRPNDEEEPVLPRKLRGSSFSSGTSAIAPVDSFRPIGVGRSSERSAPTASDTPLPSSGALDDDDMDIDSTTPSTEPYVPSPTSNRRAIPASEFYATSRGPLRSPSPELPRKGKEKEVAVNTLFASWAQGAAGPSNPKRPAPGADSTKGEEQSHSQSEDEDKREKENVEEPVMPTRKKARFVEEKTRAAKTKKATVGKQVTLDFRSKLAGFARTGSTVKEVEIEEDEPEDSEDEPSELDHHPSGQEEAEDMLVGLGEERGQGKKRQEADDLTSTPNDDMDVDLPNETIILTSDDALDAQTSEQPSQHDRPEVIRVADHGDVGLRFDLGRVAERWARTPSGKQDPSPRRRRKVPDEAGLDSSGDADTALSRVISKVDFGEMEILGQFNLGFIITRRRKEDDGMDDLFIVDQHAADEKYNFETLQEITTIRSQRLFRPQPLELTAADEMVALENIEVLRQNGFEVEVVGDPEDDEIEEMGIGTRLRLIAQPVSKSTVFDMKDLEEIIHLMQDRPAGQMVRCSKARAMFAMRACRKSVMVGMPLKQSQMSAVVRHMGKMDQPWNCPHGRPTMRHLCDLTSLPSKRGDRGIDWDAFLA